VILKAFAVYDTKAQCYAPPFFMASVGSAVRAFGDLANDRQSTINKHPEDYILYEIGTFDDNKGQLVAKLPVVSLGHGSDFVPVSPPGGNGSPVVSVGASNPKLEVKL
jgi:hypothetical protein